MKVSSARGELTVKAVVTPRMKPIRSSGKPSDEAGLRIDHCEACKGYLKTYDGQGNEELLLADWSSLHLDLLAHDRGLKRMAASMFDLGPLVAP